jgi:hypothetical protein
LAVGALKGASITCPGTTGVAWRMPGGVGPRP